jgi:hypothetical protein
MSATIYEIENRPDDHPARRADIRNFGLRKVGQAPAGKILEDPHLSLYYLDFDDRRAVFVETPVDVDLSLAPFYFITQFDTARRVWTIPFDAMIRLAQDVSLDEQRLILIYSVGRCGSTLASQIFSQVPGVINISEPHALMQLVVAQNTKLAEDDELVTLLKATMGILCKTDAETAWTIKGQSFVIELGAWIQQKGFLVAFLVMMTLNLGWSVFYTWIFTNTQGSLLLVAVLHGSEIWTAYWMARTGIDPHDLDNY